jgi:hypothetical protein
MGSLIKMHGKGVARVSPAKGGLALMRKTVTGLAQPLMVAEHCQRLANSGDYLGEGESESRFVEPAKVTHARLLRHAVEISAANDALWEVMLCDPSDEIGYEHAIAMLSVLFGALGKKKSDAGDGNAAMLLMATADAFDPVSSVIGSASGLWNSVSKHPVVLALAIKHMLATQVFQPSPAEVRQAMTFVRQRIGVLQHWTSTALAHLDRADETLFRFDYAAWTAAYANADSSAVMSMLNMLDAEQAYIDDDGIEQPPSPRWQALHDLPQTKLAAEQRSTIACEAKPARRTSKPKGTE